MTGITPANSYPYLPDLGNGQYRNPILMADYSDPDVIRVGADYYLVASSFNAIPGLPILHSKDLVNWSLVGHALAEIPGNRFRVPEHGQGVWAPAIREHNKTYYIYFPNYCAPKDGSDCAEEGIWMVSASHPLGPWSPPVQVLAERGVIDPCPFWDDDGKAYLIHAYAKSRAGKKSLLDLRPMAPDGRSLLGKGQTVYSDPQGQPTLEGPKMYRWDGWYFILAPAGGVDLGWQLALRSKSIWGPYEVRRVLEQGTTAINGPHQGGMVDTPDGKEWWFVHFQALWPYGRVVHLNPVTWKDGWPLMGVGAPDGRREPVASFRKPSLPAQPIAIPATSDDFDRTSLGLQWQWQANSDKNWYSLTQRPGWLRLFASPVADDDLLLAPQLLLQKVPARAFTVETAIDVTGLAQAGLALTGKLPSSLMVTNSGEDWVLTVRVKNTVAVKLSLPRPKKNNTLRLYLHLRDGGECQFAYDAGAGMKSIGPTFMAEKGFWIGTKVGLFTLGGSGHVDVDYFRFSPF
jgi:beta-xylosidase